MIDLPDFGTPMRSIADSVERIADATPGAPLPNPSRSRSLAAIPVPETPAKEEVRSHA